MRAGVPVFSPIAHSHPVAHYLPRENRIDHDFWMRVDGPMMEAASGLIVVLVEGWSESKGVAEEIKRFDAAGKQAIYWNLNDEVPEELLP